MAIINPIDKSFSLEQLCEANFHKLLKLIPDLNLIEQTATGYSSGKPDLYIEIIDKAPYTLTLSLSHCFTEGILEPALKIRVYLDVQLAEVLRDHERPDVRKAIRDPSHSRKIMNYKWSLNYFLEKWLTHCLQTEYQFSTDREAIPEIG